ncbi:hypothetical protein AAC387_Pa08g1811 [Persea americana]
MLAEMLVNFWRFNFWLIHVWVMEGSCNSVENALRGRKRLNAVLKMGEVCLGEFENGIQTSLLKKLNEADITRKNLICATQNFTFLVIMKIL